MGGGDSFNFPVNILTLVKGEGKVETSPPQALTIANKAVRYCKPSTGWMCLLSFTGNLCALVHKWVKCVSDKLIERQNVLTLHKGFSKLCFRRTT